MTRRAGFTLIELLVVMAIIAILAAIMFPVFARAKEAGYRASCVSNLSQIAKAMKMYAQDNENQFPLFDTPTAPSREFPGSNKYDLNSWADKLLRGKYINGGKKMLICPASKAPSQNPADWDDQAVIDAAPLDLRNNYSRAKEWGMVPYQYTYGANAWIMKTEIQLGDLGNLAAAKIIWIGETNWSFFSSQSESANGVWSQSTWDRDYLVWRHPAPSRQGSSGTFDGASNFLMLDGHVQWLGKYVRDRLVDKKGFYIAPPGSGSAAGWFGTED